MCVCKDIRLVGIYYYNTDLLSQPFLRVDGGLQPSSSGMTSLTKWASCVTHKFDKTQCGVFKDKLTVGWMWMSEPTCGDSNCYNDVRWSVVSTRGVMHAVGFEVLKV